MMPAPRTSAALEMIDKLLRDACRAICKQQATGQCAALCLSHFSTSTTKGQCPEAVRIWKHIAAAVIQSLDAAPEPLYRVNAMLSAALASNAELSTQLAEAQVERDDWMKACRVAGICMSCATGSFEPCTDCLDTGWDGGSPRGYVIEPAPGTHAIDQERQIIADEARRLAANYSDGSDGRNTFVMLAEWIESRAKGEGSAP